MEVTKYLDVQMPDGSWWRVPASTIAAYRAAYYANTDKQNDPTLSWTTTYNQEYDYTMGDDQEIIDWAANNMNWKDVETVAYRVSDTPPPDYQEGWLNGEKRVVTL